MFGKKLIVAAAAVALALGHVTAVDQASHIKVQVAHASYKTHHNTIAHAHHKQADANTTTAPAPTTAPEEEDDDEGSGDSDSVEEDAEEEEEEKEETEEDGSEEDDGSQEEDDETDETDGSADVEIDIVIEGNATTTTDTTETTEEEVSLCLPGWTEVSVEGVDDIFCAKGQICVADIKDGSCPSPQHALPLGAYCDIVKTGVYGCKPVTEDMITEEEDSPYKPVCVGKDESPMSVEGVEGVFCVTGQACVADIKDGACPVAQEGLEFGAYCDKVKTGVYGCKPKTKEMTEETDETDETDEDEEEGSDEDEGDDEEETVVDVTVCSGKDESPMSVEGVEGVFCVTGQACVADIKDGACPDAQEGLEFGAYCGTVKTGVYGCKPKTKDMYENEQVPEEEEGSDDSEEEEEETTAAPTTAPAVPAPAPAPVCSGPGQSPMSVEGVEGVFCVTGQACVADIDGACPGKQEGLPFGAYCGTVASGVKGCKPNASKHQMKKHAKAAKAAVCSGPGQSPMSVEGVEGVFCVTGQACVADIKSGACPSQQAGLPWGAYCDKVKTGVYGCKPQTEEMWKAQHQQSGSNGLCTGPGQSPMSVEGVQGVFCVTGQACVANIDGACPGKQAGLPFGSYCGTVQTGVKGCKPNSGKHHKGHKIKVTKVSAKKIHHKKH